MHIFKQKYSERPHFKLVHKIKTSFKSKNSLFSIYYPIKKSVLTFVFLLSQNKPIKFPISVVL